MRERRNTWQQQEKKGSCVAWRFAHWINSKNCRCLCTPSHYSSQVRERNFVVSFPDRWLCTHCHLLSWTPFSSSSFSSLDFFVFFLLLLFLLLLCNYGRDGTKLPAAANHLFYISIPEGGREGGRWWWRRDAVDENGRWQQQQQQQNIYKQRTRARERGFL